MSFTTIKKSHNLVEKGVVLSGLNSKIEH